jgi:hypothetical protein
LTATLSAVPLPAGPFSAAPVVAHDKTIKTERKITPAGTNVFFIILFFSFSLK